MTTAPHTASTGPRPGAVGPVVRVALTAVLILGAALALVGGLTSGRPAVLGVLIGALMVCVFFGVGAVILDVVAALAPAASLLIALLTYTLKVVLIGLVFVGLTQSGALEQTIDARWLAGTVIASTLVWLTAQVIASMRARLPIYDLPADNGPQAAPQEPPAAGEAGAR
jgi:ATP synthase protein I